MNTLLILGWQNKRTRTKAVNAPKRAYVSNPTLGIQTKRKPRIEALRAVYASTTEVIADSGI